MGIFDSQFSVFAIFTFHESIIYLMRTQSVLFCLKNMMTIYLIIYYFRKLWQVFYKLLQQKKNWDEYFSNRLSVWSISNLHNFTLEFPINFIIAQRERKTLNFWTTDDVYVMELGAPPQNTPAQYIQSLKIPKVQNAEGRNTQDWNNNAN